MGKTAKKQSNHTKLQPNIALESSKQNAFTKNVTKLKKELKDEANAAPTNIPDYLRRGLIYISHLPHGFHEEQLRSYFKQFGRVTNVRVLRSERTGRSKGAGFVEFDDADVAKVAAETMDNYLMFKRRLETKYVEPEDRHRTTFQIRIGPQRFPLKKRISKMRAEKNRKIDQEEHQRKIIAKLRKLQRDGMLDCVQVAHLNFPVPGVDLDQSGSLNNTVVNDPEIVIAPEMLKRMRKIQKEKKPVSDGLLVRKIGKSMKAKKAKLPMVLNPMLIEKFEAEQLLNNSKLVRKVEFPKKKSKQTTNLTNQPSKLTVAKTMFAPQQVIKQTIKKKKKKI